MPLLELSASTLSSLRLPAHIGRGDAAITRTARNESLFDVLTRLREDNEALQQRFAEPLEQPPQVQLEIGIVKGRLTDQNPLDRIALQRVAAEVLDLGVRKYLGGRRSVRCRILLQVRLELLARHALVQPRESSGGRSGRHRRGRGGRRSGRSCGWDVCHAPAGLRRVAAAAEKMNLFSKCTFERELAPTYLL